MITHSTPKPPYTLSDLKAIMAKLRDPECGCPWDIEQTYQSITPYTIEEAYEVADAIARNNMADLQEELGDLLLQVIYQSQFAAEDGHFTFDDVIHGICEKMIVRHPHVFGERSRHMSMDALHDQWNTIKRREKPEKTHSTEVGAVKSTLPALVYAEKLGAKAAKYQFDWPDVSSIIEKIHEECDEIIEQDANLEEEIGDLMFAIIQLCRKAQLDPEMTLRKASMKFQERFNRMARETPLPDTLIEWEKRWQQIKETSDRDTEVD